MNFLQAFRLGTASRVALAGSGGKTTAMFTVAREYPGPVIVTATAHMAIEQLTLADQQVVVEDALPAVWSLPPGVTLFTGPPNNSGKMTGLNRVALHSVLAVATQYSAPLFVEADGSRSLPLKAPAEHEPPIPEFVDTVLYVAGLSGLGHPLNAEHVHRPERYASLSGLGQGDIITPEAIAQVMCDPSGGLKNIPAQARRIAVLNQADTPELQAQARIIAQRLLPAYHAVAITALKYQQIFAVQEPTAGVILAAGASTRMGQPKPLLLWRGEPFIRHVARTALGAGLSPVVIVAGEHTSEVRAAVADMPVGVIHNPDWAAGQSTSVRRGLLALPDTIGSAIFLLADQPHIPIELVTALKDQHAQAFNPIVAPLIDGRRGNPVLFDRVTFADMQALSGDVGGRAVFARHSIAYVPWLDATLLLDVDTPDDYQRLLGSLRAGDDD